MKCPACKSKHVEVRDTRPVSNGTRRRRECLDCEHRWTTIEIDMARYHALLKQRGRKTTKRGRIIVPDHLKAEYRRLMRAYRYTSQEAARMLGIVK